jgi:aspartyl-tRNA(Asn)/glutamyl-tRNA(Gln) amidotransferase subunit A
MSIPSQTISTCLESLANGSLTSRQLVEQTFATIETNNKPLQAVIRLRKEDALQEADQRDQERSAGQLKGRLHGVPFLVKDNMAIDGQEVTACSKILETFKPTYTATAIKNLIAEGAIVIGQCNMDEFAMGSSTETSCFGSSKNPWDHERVCGGSSGGSAAAVSAGFTSFSLGSDTGGSIRQPASFCGVVGLKPTYGRVSRYGLFAYASSLDQIGPITHSVEDAKTILSMIEGVDGNDNTTAPSPTALKKEISSIRGMKIGIPKEFMDTNQGLRPEVKTLLEDTLGKLEKEGAELIEVSLPILDHVISTYYMIANSEASSNLARYDSIRYGYRTSQPDNLLDSYMTSRQEGMGTEVKTRIMLGTYALSAGYYDAYYKKANAIRSHMRHQLTEIFEKVDVLVGPTAPNVAFKIGEMVDDPLSMYMQDLYTTFVNLVSAPALSVPCGTVDKMPVGLQIIGPLFGEDALFSVGKAVEQVRDFQPLN